MRSSSGPLRLAVAVLAILIVVAAVLVRADPGGGLEVGVAEGVAGNQPAVTPVASEPPRYAGAPSPMQVRMAFKRPPRSGVMWDVRTGRVLWSREADRRRPVASLAKMMTAIVVADRSKPADRVLITREALAQAGSKVGLLPPGRRMRLETLLHGLLLPSGNDAAVALAQHVEGGVPAFVAEMNATGRRLGLRCTSFSSPHGLRNAGNTSCVRDLALIAREVMSRPRLARIVGIRQVALPSLLPHRVKRGKPGEKKRTRTVWKPGLLWLNNHNPLLRAGYRGTTGVKTGYTDAAGRCLVATVRRGRTTLGIVLLNSPDPGGQAMRILDRGFAAVRAGPPPWARRLQAASPRP